MPKRRDKFWLEPEPKSPCWYIHWYDPGRRRVRRKSSGETDYQRAQVELARHVLTHDRPRDASPEDVRLSVVMAGYLASMTERPSYEQAVIANTYIIGDDDTKGFLLTDKVSHLTSERQDEFINWLRAKGHSDSYVSRTLSVLRAGINKSWKGGEIASAPFIKDVEHGAPRDRLLSMKELAALLDAMGKRQEHLFRFTVIMLNTLSRPGAVMGLTRFQVDFEHRLVDLNPSGRRQTKKYRPIVPLTDNLYGWLRQWGGDRYVQWAGDVASVRTAFRRARSEAGLGKDVIPYTLRHTMATALRRRGVSQWELAGMLGHRHPNLRTTERYAKYAPDYLGEASAAIDAYIGELNHYTIRDLHPNVTRNSLEVIEGGV